MAKEQTSQEKRCTRLEHIAWGPSIEITQQQYDEFRARIEFARKAENVRLSESLLNELYRQGVR